MLDRASCAKCRDATSNFERIVTREMYWPLRLRLGLKGSKKHKDRPKHWIGVLEDGDKIEDMPIEVDKFPRIYCLLEMEPPGLLTGKAPISGSPEMKLILKGANEDINRLMRDVGAKTFEYVTTLEWAPFSRMIAKICHACAVANIGLAGVEFFLPSLILGQSDHLAQFVGGISDAADELQSPNDLCLAVKQIVGQPYLVARTTIFGNGRFPTYEAIVGRITDQDLIQQKLTGAIEVAGG